MATTSTANKSAAPAAKKAAAPKPPAVDFTNLSAETVDKESLPKSSRTPKVAKTPVFGWFKESMQTGNGKAVTVPNAQVKSLVSLIRQAANALNTGSRVVEKPNSDGTTTVVFSQKARRQYKPRERSAAK